MINKEIRDRIVEIIGEEAMVLDNPSFDNSIIGIQGNRVVYSYDKMVEELMKDDNIEYIDAVEFIDYNTMRALPYFGENAPIIIEEIKL